MAKYAVIQFTCTGENGDVLPGATVEIRAHTSGSPLVPLYENRTGTSNKDNPDTADDEGFYRAYAPAGAYSITVTKDAYTRTWNHYAVGTAAEYDANDLLFAYSMHFGIEFKPTSGHETLPIDVPLEMYLPEDLPNSYARLRTAPADGSYEVSFVKNGVEFATATFAVGEEEGVIVCNTEVELAEGDQVWAVMPSPADSAAADFTAVILARR